VVIHWYVDSAPVTTDIWDTFLPVLHCVHVTSSVVHVAAAGLLDATELKGQRSTFLSYRTNASEWLNGSHTNWWLLMIEQQQKALEIRELLNGFLFGFFSINLLVRFVHSIKLASCRFIVEDERISLLPLSTHSAVEMRYRIHNWYWHWHEWQPHELMTLDDRASLHVKHLHSLLRIISSAPPVTYWLRSCRKL